jgi:predicted acetyltransferase
VQIRIETVPRERLEEFETRTRLAFHEHGHPADIAIDVALLEPETTYAIRDDGAMVAMAAAFERELTVPGAMLPVSAVSAVGVVPGHTRRGFLGALMRRQLDDAHAAGMAVAALWVSEGAIYGRYGYGPATRSVNYELQLPRGELRAGLPLPAERARLVTEPDAALPQAREVFEQVRPRHPGVLGRSDGWWARRVHDPEHRRDGFGPLRAVVQPGPGGQPAAYALYSAVLRWDDHGPAGELRVRELVATTPEARAGLWRYLLGLDLIRTLGWGLAPDHDPLAHMLASTDPLVRKVGGGLWVRLIDVGAALAARRYAVPLDVVLEVSDAFCPWNEGRRRLRADGDEVTCEPTSAAADLELDAAVLGAAYLGGTRLDTLAGAGLVRELRPGALARAALAFRAAAEPWCPEIF